MQLIPTMLSFAFLKNEEAIANYIPARQSRQIMAGSTSEEYYVLK